MATHGRARVRPWRLRFDHIGGWSGEPMPIVLGCPTHGVVGVVYQLEDVRTVLAAHRDTAHAADPEADLAHHPMDAAP